MISNNEKMIIAKELKILGLILSADVTKEVIEAYVRILQEYDFTQIKNSISKASRSFKFFPKPVELIQLIAPSGTKEDANAIVANIFVAIKKFGHMQGKEAKDFLGPTSWSTVLACGGWREICFYEGAIGTQKAQMRDMALSVMDSPNIKNRLNKRDEKILKANPDFKLLSFDSHGVFKNKEEAK